MKKIRLGIVNSNFIRIGPFSKKGTEIFDYILISGLDRYKKKTILMTTFCSGNSQIPGKKESIAFHSSSEDKNITEKNYLIFELALVAKALELQNKFDLFHVNLGCGEHMLPFARFTKKPILITMHGLSNAPHMARYFNLFKGLKNVFFVPISESQKKALPGLNYANVIYHGIDADKKYTFNETGGKNIIWTGRAVPDKGLDTVLTVSRKTKKLARVFPIIKEEYISWLHNEIIKKRDIINQIVNIHIDFNLRRHDLITEYQHSKLFLFPLRWEEPFGLTVIEAMACGTPVIAYARGSMPELVKDGETGFLVNSSPEDVRGNWKIKKTGVEGLCEAVEYIYKLPEEEYKKMRLACRKHVEQNFTVTRMVDQYEQMYAKLVRRPVTSVQTQKV